MTRIIIGIRYNHIPDSRPLLLENSNLFNLHVSMFIDKLASDPAPPRKTFKLYLGLEPQPHPRKKIWMLAWVKYLLHNDVRGPESTRGRVRISKVHSSDLLLNVRIHPHPLHCNNLSYKTAVSYQICSYLVSIRSSCMSVYIFFIVLRPNHSNFYSLIVNVSILIGQDGDFPQGFLCFFYINRHSDSIRNWKGRT